jgi:integrase-like protein/Homeodomain-like domain-containing protein
MLSEADLIAKRAALRWVAERHPQWTHQELADVLGMARSWVSKWLKRLRQADPQDVMALHARSRARHTPPASIASQPALVQRILEIRTAPPEHLQRVPGPEAILYYLHRDPTLTHAGVRLPRSQTPIWKILRQSGCIAQDRRRKPRPREPRQPGEEVQFDLKDATSVPADPEGKRQHVVEIANFVDAGTSIWLHRQVGTEFDAEGLLEVVAQFLCEHGLPAMLTFDNDPRFVGSSSGRDFPSALVRFLLCVGVMPNVIPPHRPDLNPYVERFHRTLGQECLQIHLPRTREQVQEATEAFLTHYNDERPNQACSCGNQPPHVAYQQFPNLPAVPRTVDPDRWLGQVNKQAFARTVRAGGDLTINRQDYYVSRTLAGHRVTCWVNAAEKEFEIWQPGRHIKSVPIKGLHGQTMPFEEYVVLMKREACSEYRHYLHTHSRLAQGRLWA